MDEIVSLLRHCATQFSSSSAQAVLDQWKDVLASHEGSQLPIYEDFVGANVFVFGTGAITGNALEERTVCIIGLERCLSLTANNLDSAAYERVRSSVLERTLQRFDATGDAIAAQASQALLFPGQTAAAVTEPLRAVLSILLRCIGEGRLTVRDVLDLARGDVALTVAIIAEGLSSAPPPGLPQWRSQLALMLQQLTTTDTFVCLWQRAQPDFDFNNMPIADLQVQQSVHNQAVALSFVQFDVLDRMLKAAEDAGNRQVIMAALIQTLHNLVRGRALQNCGRLLSRCIALDFMRLGFRFLAPFVRKLLEGCQGVETARLLRHTCRTFSWLIVHAESEANTFLLESLRPLSVEWALRGQGIPEDCHASVVVLALNCGALEGPTASQLETVLEFLKDGIEVEGRRCPAFTSAAHTSLVNLGFNLPALSSDDSEYVDAAEDAPTQNDAEACSQVFSRLVAEFGGELDDDAVDHLRRIALTERGGKACIECGEISIDGEYGEGYFDGLWYCQRCWDQWVTSFPDKVFLGPWPSDCSHVNSVEQRGAAVLLLQAPGSLRCGISGRLLSVDPVRIPNSGIASYPVAFERKTLEKWQRRSGGSCPITSAPLDLHTVTAAPDGLLAVTNWLRDQQMKWQ